MNRPNLAGESVPLGGDGYQPRVVIDCRWLGHAGPGRVTELLLRGLAQITTEVRWILWGPAEPVRRLAWQGAEVAEWNQKPNKLRGQAAWFAIPACELAVFMHQQRPLRRLPSLSVIYDTIPLRFAQNSFDRWVKRQFLRRVVRISRQVMTFSQHSKTSIQNDLGAGEQRVSLLQLPVDSVRAERLAQMRLKAPQQNLALFVGRFLPHKNLRLLIEAFGKTGFAAQGGRLMLVGGSAEEAASLTATLDECQRDFVEARTICSDQELDELFAGSLFLIQPSLEEGFGLPVWEALSCGMPVCASNGGSLPEITLGQVRHFAPHSTAEISEAIDRCADEALARTPEQIKSLADSFKQEAPDAQQFAADFYSLIWSNLSLEQAGKALDKVKQPLKGT